MDEDEEPEVELTGCCAVLCCAGVQVEVTMDEDEEPEVELTGDAGAPVDVSRVPIIVSVSQVRGKIQGLEGGREGGSGGSGDANV